MLGLLLLATIPFPPVIEDRVDVIEINHFYDDRGRHVFDQVIFWDWDCHHSRLQVRAWRTIKKNWQFRKDWERDCWVACGRDGEVPREVRAAAFRESWEQYDPELVEREVIPKERRRELSK